MTCRDERAGRARPSDPGHRRARLACGAIAAAGSALILATSCELTARVPRVAHRVEIRAMRYEPPVVRAAVGDTVRWINLDLVPHTVTSAVGGFDSGDMPPDSSWLYVVVREGTAEYACLYHPGMKGSVAVPDQGASPAAAAARSVTPRGDGTASATSSATGSGR